MRKYIFIKISPLLILISCATVETQNSNLIVDEPIKVDENQLFIDYLGPVKRQLITRKMQKFKREKLRGEE